MMIYLGVIALNLVLPSGLLLWLHRSRAQSRIYLASIALLSLCVLLALSLSILGGWYVLGTFWPWVFASAWIGVVVARFRRGLPAAWAPAKWKREFMLTGCNLLMLGVWGLSLPYLATASSYAGSPLSLSAPLRGSTFYVMGGGANWSVNHHAFIRELRYAMDVVELNAFGFRAPTLMPRSVDLPYIFGSEIVAPCDGEVIGAQDNLPNQPLLVPDVANRSGNHVTIYCEEHSVLLAHMRPGTVAVHVGEHVSEGQRLGEVGNSGSTTEPHLHIHAVEGRHADAVGSPTPILIDGDFLVKGETFGS